MKKQLDLVKFLRQQRFFTMALYVLLGPRKTEYLSKMSSYSMKELAEWQSGDNKDKDRDRRSVKSDDSTCHEVNLF